MAVEENWGHGDVASCKVKIETSYEKRRHLCCFVAVTLFIGSVVVTCVMVGLDILVI